MTTHLQTGRRRRVRKTRRAARPQRHGIHVGWYVTAAVGLLAAFNSWPLYTGLVLGVAVVATVVVAVLARRCSGRLGGVKARIAKVTSTARHVLPKRSAIPSQRTVEAFYALSPGKFEQAIAELAMEDDDTMQATVVGGSGDGGMDVRVLRSDGSHVLVQCKRYRKGGNVPARDVRDANGAYWDLHRCHRAVIVTTADFTRDAKATNTRLRQQVRLVNGGALVAWATGGPSPLT